MDINLITFKFMDIDYSSDNNNKKCLLEPQTQSSSDCINNNIQTKGGSLYKDIRDVYKFKNIIGGGQFGTVRYALKKSDKNQSEPKLYAIKSISKKNLEEDDLKALIKEVDILSALDHPNIIRFIESYNDDLYFHIVMEATQGKDLFEKLLENGVMSEEKACDIAFKIFSAICYCHSNGISHRDIKAENILFATNSLDSEIKLIDFGLSKKYHEKEKMETILGTPYYVAPEVLKGSYDEKCDIWSVGALIYIMIIGEPPFNAKSNNLIFNKILNEEAQYNGPKFFNISVECIEVLKKCLCKNPKERLSSKEILELPWFSKVRNATHSINHIKKDYLINLINYPFHTRFHRLISKYIISFELNFSLNEELRPSFKALDLNHCGYLTEAELKRGFELLNIEYTGDLKQLAQKISSTNKGITFTDFICAVVDKSLLLKQEHILAAFKYFDLDRNDVISVKDIEGSLLRTGREVLDRNEIMAILIEVTGKAEITKEEFLSMLNKCS